MGKQWLDTRKKESTKLTKIDNLNYIAIFLYNKYFSIF